MVARSHNDRRHRRSPTTKRIHVRTQWPAGFSCHEAGAAGGRPPTTLTFLSLTALTPDGHAAKKEKWETLMHIAKLFRITIGRLANFGIAGAIALLAMHASASAQEFPSRPITIVCPFG